MWWNILREMNHQCAQSITRKTIRIALTCNLGKVHMARKQPNPVFPATVLVDTREQTPYPLADIPADKAAGGGCWQVKTERIQLPTGDYSLDGYATAIAIERKSMADLFSTLGGNRPRFIRELERLDKLAFAAVVVEAEWSEIFNRPPRYSKLAPKTIYRSVLAWNQRYPRVHWHFVPGRETGEVTTLRILERFLTEQRENSFRKPSEL
jgi:ERCC4-type nuclease